MSTTATNYLDELVAQVGPDGGWGYTAGYAGQLEATCLALLALDSERTKYHDARQAGLACLKTHVLGDGSVRLNRGRPEAVWPTALALYTLAALGAPEDQVTPLGAAVLGVECKTFEQDYDISDIDAQLRGWPWAENNFSWVEPTSWACLGLQRIGQDDQERVQEGLKLLLDRTLPEGGLNYGNRIVMGLALEPIPTPTALGLLALQRVPREERILKSVRYLAERAHLGEDVEHLCWARLALDVYRDLPGVAEAVASLRERIEAGVVARRETPYLRPNPARVALTALALNVENRNPFRLPPSARRDLLTGRKLFGEGSPGFVERWRRTFRDIGVVAQAAARLLEPKSAVHIAPVTDYNADLADILARQYENFRAEVPLKGKRVVLKPNMVEYHRNKVINTNPNVVAAVIDLCLREGAAEVIVAEGPGHWRNVEYLVSASGLGDVLRTYKVPFVDLNHDEPIQRPNRGRFTKLEHIYLAQTIATADVVISLPKLKTHHWVGATLSLKNLFGTVPGICYGWPKNELHWRGIHNSIVDIASTRLPNLAIVDGIVGMEGDGPLNGTPVASGVIVMGSDLVAVDATCCRLMQLAPEKIDYLRMAAGLRLGWVPESRIEQRGEVIAARRRPFAVIKQFEELQVR